MNTHITDLKTKGFVTVAYPNDLRQAVEDIIVSWKAFCELSDSEKMTLQYSNTSAGVGYELKNGEGEKADHKENFDITLAGREWLESNALQTNNPIVLKLIHDATALVSLIKPLIVDFAHQSEEAFGLTGFTEEVEESEDAFFIRLIHYFGGREVEEETAVAHVDQSTFAPYLFGTAPGLQYLRLDSIPEHPLWEDMPIPDGKTVIMPAMQMQLRSEGEIKALCHRVIANTETAREGRYSGVCFVRAKKLKVYNKEDFGRLQEKEPGFNYRMPQDEFAKMFK